ncbi:MAG: tyrosine-type recombinase/integrase [Leifsonia sp.]
MSHPSKVSLIGPLAVWREQLIVEFDRLGYAPSTVARHLQLLAHLSRWMSERGVDAAGLSWSEVVAFCSAHGVSHVRRFAPPPLVILMRVVRPDCTPVKTTAPGEVFPPAAEELLASFGEYLHRERALAATTTALYLYQLRRFAKWFLPRFGSELAAMTIAAIDQFYLDQAGVWSTASARSSTIALRALSRWLFLSGRSAVDLSEAIATVKDASRNDLPRALSTADVTALLAVRMSVRDNAIVLLLVRLGLRANEVARLRLDDFNWRAGTVLVRGKGDDAQLMPVPAEVGSAIAAYLSAHRRVGSPYREVFLGTYTPNRPLSRSSVSGVVSYLARRAGIPGPVAAHRLRHSAAMAVLAGGGTLSEAGQLLRHRNANSTMIYAQADQVQLAQLSRPWPMPMPMPMSQESAHE